MHLRLLSARVALIVLFLFIVDGLVRAPVRSDSPDDPTPPTQRAPLLFQPDGPKLTFFPLVPYYRPDLTIAAVQVVQATALSSSFAVYVADRPAIVRAYVAVNDGSNVPGVTARLFAYNELGALAGSLDSSPITTPSLESDMARTLNFSLPPAWIRPGYSYYVQLDPNNRIAETNENNNRYPSSGTMAFNFSIVRPLHVMIVPILYRPYGVTFATLPKLDNRSYLEWMPAKVLPVASITFQVHPNYTYAPGDPTLNLDDASGAGWLNLLNELSTLHAIEEPYGTVIYYGLVNSFDAHGCDNGCFTGMGWVVGQGGGLPTSIGWSGMPNGSPTASKTFTHEMGHNFGREHVRCAGSESQPDPYYPYNPRSIGVWGLDVATATLYDPSQYADYMSYCDAAWTSDYTYQGIKSFRDQHIFDPGLDVAPVPAYYISGLIGPDGTVTLSPVYQQVAPLPSTAQGAYSVELLGTDGQVLASRAFTPVRAGDAPGYSGFGIFTPAVDGLAALRVSGNGRVLVEKSVSAPRRFGGN